MQPNCLRRWLLIAFCSVFVTSCVFSFASQFGNLIYAVSLARHQVTVRAALSARILARLEDREQLESDPWLRDDLRIAWSTVLYAERGETHPHFWATYNALRVSPDEVWPMIVERRKVQLGALYSRFYDENDLPRLDETIEAAPKKPAQCAKVEVTRQTAKAAAA